MITQLKRTPGLYLAGFMGAGKTTIGRLLAERLGWPFADLDDDIEVQEGVPIADIFRNRGEAEFRRIEREALHARVRAIERGDPLVLAVGGGAFVQPDNFALISGNGISIWLDCPLDTIKRRIAGQTHRPLAADQQNFERLYAARREHYSRADYRIEIGSDDPRVAVDTILLLPVF